jgi:hypothetical protein
MANCEMTRGYFKWDGTRKLSNQQPGTGKTFKDSCILRGPSSKRSQTLERNQSSSLTLNTISPEKWKCGVGTVFSQHIIQITGRKC